ncbi:DNA-binding PadR family transcriptional regulator [Mycetocola sp. BIGb0189]|uniref:PadR family transcriptional regulator n=1 Tax=Mycetocola sp. BIGb0189 TaxID=2940604 RepID=UPI00216825ED|nr:PadR family transcriptional regulator [Mycetocola sp. BIGb0189]MCS4276072.1 DNA-binding PadR family transcriptional regulator [Mycetocola sp. BIGb0189]
MSERHHVSVKGSLLAILTLGPAYGLQIRDELTVRAPHRAGINVGQIYGTLDRLLTAGLVRSAGLTEDSLPLYELSADGVEFAASWTTGPEQAQAPDWIDMQDQLLITASLPGSADDVRALLVGYREAWSSWAESAEIPEAPHAAQPFVTAARAAQAEAALAWIDRVGAELASGRAVERAARPLRPRRGRKPTRGVSA